MYEMTYDRDSRINSIRTHDQFGSKVTECPAIIIPPAASGRGISFPGLYPHEPELTRNRLQRFVETRTSMGLTVFTFPESEEC